MMIGKKQKWRLGHWLHSPVHDDSGGRPDRAVILSIPPIIPMVEEFPDNRIVADRRDWRQGLSESHLPGPVKERMRAMGTEEPNFEMAVETR